MKTVLMTLAIAMTLVVARPASAQRAPNTETRSGTVTEVQKKGRTRTLVVSIDGQEYQFPITPKVNLQIQLEGGDESLIQQGVYLEGEGTLTNNRLFLESAQIRLLPNGARAPASRMVKPETQVPGQSVNAHFIAGVVMSRQTSADYPEYEEALLRPAPNVPPIFFQKSIKPKVVTSDPDQIHGGESIEMQVIAGRNDKLTLVSATVSGGTYSPSDPKEK